MGITTYWSNGGDQKIDFNYPKVSLISDFDVKQGDIGYLTFESPEEILDTVEPIFLTTNWSHNLYITASPDKRFICLLAPTAPGFVLWKLVDGQYVKMPDSDPLPSNGSRIYATKAGFTKDSKFLYISHAYGAGISVYENVDDEFIKSDIVIDTGFTNTNAGGLFALSEDENTLAVSSTVAPYVRIFNNVGGEWQSLPVLSNATTFITGMEFMNTENTTYPVLQITRNMSGEFAQNLMAAVWHNGSYKLAESFHHYNPISPYGGVQASKKGSGYIIWIASNTGSTDLFFFQPVEGFVKESGDIDNSKSYKYRMPPFPAWSVVFMEWCGVLLRTLPGGVSMALQSVLFQDALIGRKCVYDLQYKLNFPVNGQTFKWATSLGSVMDPNSEILISSYIGNNIFIRRLKLNFSVSKNIIHTSTSYNQQKISLRQVQAVRDGKAGDIVEFYLIPSVGDLFDSIELKN